MKTRNASSDSDGEDRISRLPDALIHHIMSFIDTKYAVQTCVLSKRWIDIWKSLPVLNFDRSSFSSDNTERFIDFVYMVFMFRDDTNVQNFTVFWEDSAFDKMVIKNVNRWSLNAVKHNVQQVRIVIGQLHNSGYEIPHRLLNCKSLEKLAIQVFDSGRYADIILSSSMNLPQLKELFLYGLSISNVELSKRLFSSCPVLEILLIVDCNIQTDNLRNFIVDSVSLKKFEYACRYRHLLPQNDTMANIIKLSAPNLEEFTCRSFMTQEFSLENCSPLSVVDFQMFLEENEEDENAEAYSELPSDEKDLYAKRMMQFLRAVHMVKELTLSPGFLEVFSRAFDLLHCRPPRLHSLKILGLRMWSTRGCMRATAYLILISPNIEEICLEYEESNLADVGDDWEAGLLSPGTLSRLKCIEIDKEEGSDAELKLLGFVLKNATVLEEVKLYFRSMKLKQVKRILQFLEAVYMVKELSLPSGFLEVLSGAFDLLDCQPPRLHNLKCLRLGIWSTRGCMRATAYLLGNAPNIEEIFLVSEEDQESNLADVGDDWEVGLPLPGTLSCLKYMQIDNAEGSDAELKLLGFVLKNATVLELVEIYCRSEDSEQVERFIDSVRALPTASSNIEIL